MSTGKHEALDNDSDRETKHPIDVKYSTYKTLSYRAKEKGLSIRQYVNDLLYLVTKKQDFIKRYCPDIYLDVVGKNSLYLKDYRPVLDDTSIGSPQTAEISIVDNRVYCSLDKCNDCVHIHFAYCLPEIAVLLRERDDNEHEEEQQQEEEREQIDQEIEEEEEEADNKSKKKVMPHIARSSLVSIALGAAALNSMMYLTASMASTSIIHHASHILTHLVS